MSVHGPGGLLEIDGRLDGQGYVQIFDALDHSARALHFPEPNPINDVYDRHLVHMWEKNPM